MNKQPREMIGAARQSGSGITRRGLIRGGLLAGLGAAGLAAASSAIVSARKLAAIPAGAALAVAAITWAPSASASVVYHAWINDKTQNCLAILSGTNNAIVYSCNSHSDQQWVLQASTYPYDPTYGSTYTLSNGNHDCLGIDGGSTAGGAQAIQWSCNGHADQSWYVYPIPGFPAGYTEYINVGSRDCLALDGSTTNVIQWSCNGHNDQEWEEGAVN